MQAVRNILYGGSPLSCQFVAVNIAVEQFFQLPQYTAMDYFTDDKLTVVKPFCISKQQFKLGNDDILAERIDIYLILCTSNWFIPLLSIVFVNILSEIL